MRFFLFTSMIALFVAMPVLAGGQGESESDEPVELTYWDENAGPDRTPHYEELIERFNDEHPNIEVEYVGLPWEDSRERYEVAIASDDLPDVGGVSPRWIANFSMRGALMPLDDLMEESGLDEKISLAYQGFTRDLVPDDTMYMIPHSANASTIWYRSDWFDDAGLDAPETWDDFFEAVETLRDEDEERYGYSLRGGHGGEFNLIDAILTYSGNQNIVDEDGNSILNDPEIIDFVDRYLGLYRDGLTPEGDITLGYREMVSNFTTGLVAMISHNLGSQPDHAEAFDSDQFGNVPPPQGPDLDVPYVQTDSIGRAIFEGTEHPEEAWTLLEWLSEHEAQSFWNEAIGQIPTHVDVMEEEEWVQEAEHILTMTDLLSDPDTKVIQRPIHYPDYNEITDELVVPGMQEVMAGDRETEDFMEEWHEAMEDAHQVYEEEVLGN